MRARCETWRAWAARTACAVATVLAASGPAHAFYWYDWPGSGLRVQQTLIPPHHDSPANPPVIVVPPDFPQPPGTVIPPVPIGPPVPINKPPVGPNPTPEPSTGLIGLIGLGALAAVRRWRKRQSV
jgi:MYXO-CTERM domain-containing protein